MQVTKSANYCYTMNGEGLLLLCDVALGEMQLEKNGKDIKKPKRGKNSVKGKNFQQGVSRLKFRKKKFGSQQGDLDFNKGNSVQGRNQKKISG